MKKLIFVLILIAFGSMTSFAADNPTVALDYEWSEGKAAVTVSISENADVCGGGFNIVYDSSLIKPESYHIHSLLENASCMVNLSYAENIIRVSWAGTLPINGDGELISVIFSSVTEESFETEISFDRAKLADAGGEKILSQWNDLKVVHERKKKTGKTHPVSGGSTGYKPVQILPEKNPLGEKILPFSDVGENDWFYESVLYAYTNKLMNGVSESVFAPDENVTRAMFVTVLFRIEKEPLCEKHGFSDVEEGKWYSDAVSWANFAGIVKGVSETEFSPDEDITREQMAAVIYRYIKFKGGLINENPEFDLSVYSDFGEVSEYATEAFKYVCAKGIINGISETILAPGEKATRAQMAAILKRIKT